MEEEKWKKIKGYERYEVSSLGRVRNVEKGYLMRLGISNNYLTIILCKNGNIKIFYVHRLVASHFIPNPKNKKEVDHINHVRTDNRISNLRWASFEENRSNIEKYRKNISQFKGVDYSKANKKFRARIHHNKKEISLGYYENENDAVFAFNLFSLLINGDFAVLNPVPDDHMPSNEMWEYYSNIEDRLRKNNLLN